MARVRPLVAQRVDVRIRWRRPASKPLGAAGRVKGAAGQVVVAPTRYDVLWVGRMPRTSAGGCRCRESLAQGYEIGSEGDDGRQHCDSADAGRGASAVQADRKLATHWAIASTPAKRAWGLATIGDGPGSPQPRSDGGRQAERHAATRRFEDPVSPQTGLLLRAQGPAIGEYCGLGTPRNGRSAIGQVVSESWLQATVCAQGSDASASSRRRRRHAGKPHPTGTAWLRACRGGQGTACSVSHRAYTPTLSRSVHTTMVIASAADRWAACVSGAAPLGCAA